MNQLGFAFRKTKTEHCEDEIRVLVDGHDFLETIDDEMLGLDPPQFFDQSAIKDEGYLYVGRCSCGELGCGSALVSVTRTDAEVKWLLKHGLENAQTFVFDSTDYDRSFERASQDTSWETVERTAERLISKIDFSIAKQYGLEFQWAYARRDGDKVELCFIKGEGNQQIFRVPWNHKEPHDATLAVETMLKQWKLKDKPHDTTSEILDRENIWQFIRDIEGGLVALVPVKEPQQIYLGNVHYKASNGWEIVVFNDCNEWQHIDEIISSCGSRISFDELCESFPDISEYAPFEPISLSKYQIPSSSKLWKCPFCDEGLRNLEEMNAHQCVT